MNQTLSSNLPHEDEIEEEANSHVSLLKNFRVAKCEYKRFFLFGIIFGIIGFIYSFMRILKDTFVMTRQEPTCILYLKIFYVMPASFAVVIILNFMLSSRSVSKIFTIFSLIFMGLFFGLGILILFEDKVMFSPIHIKSQFDLCKFDVRGLGFLKYFLLTINEPIATLIYLMAELWGSLILSYLFLSYLNESCTRRQHGRFIPPLFIITNLSLLASAIVTTFFFKLRAKLSYEQNIFLMSGIFFLEAALVFLLLYCKYYLEKIVMATPIFIPAETKKGKVAKTETGFQEGLEIMGQSRFLLAMCEIVLFFSLIFNVLESVYKNGIKRGAEALGREKGKYSGLYNNIDQYITSIAVIVLNLSPFSTLVDKKGWTLVAMISPIIAVISITGILGLGIYNSAAEETSFGPLNAMFGGFQAYYQLENFVGTLCMSSMKIFKFAAFDVTKEKISMRIESRHRPKFKSVYDGIFNKFGKSVGAIYGIIISSFFSEIDLRGMSPITSLFCSLCIFSWILAVRYLGKSYSKSVKNNENVDIDLAEGEKEVLDADQERIIEKNKIVEGAKK